jgi:hypothetical protein
MTWESIDELPIDRFTAWNRYMMLDNSIGSTFDDIDRIHLSQMAAVVDDKVKVIQQIANFRQLVWGIINSVNYQHYAYACLVHSIDGEEMTDFTESGVQRTIARLAKIGVPNGMVKKKISIAKKFSTAFWKLFFPNSSQRRRRTRTTKS